MGADSLRGGIDLKEKGVMRTFKLTDDCTLSGRRLHRDERRIEGGADLKAPLARSADGMSAEGAIMLIRWAGR